MASSKNDSHKIDFAGRRKTFLSRIKNAVAVFPSAPSLIRNDDVHHPFRQESNFFYLTGHDEPNAMCILAPNSKTPFQMFVQPKDPTKEMWEGKILGVDGAKSTLGANAAYPSNTGDFDRAFIEAMKDADVVYYRLGWNTEFDSRMIQLLRKAVKELGRTGRPLWPVMDPTDILGDMRQIKSKPEIERLARAAAITADAHVNAMKISKPGMYEYEIEAILYHSFRVQGASRLGYGSIVAAGQNACVLHYTTVDKKIQDRDLLLIDAGAEFDYYTADITRTFPVSGTFTHEQREVYSAVLKVQKDCIKMVKPGRTMREIHEAAIEGLTEELKRLKVLKGATDALIKKKAFFPFYPHGTGHWLGMDVHDTGKYYTGELDRYRKLEPGMVFTIEPGLYFSPDVAVTPARYKGIGVRIEDDILVTEKGCTVLTSGAPKEVDELESLCSR